MKAEEAVRFIRGLGINVGSFPSQFQKEAIVHYADIPCWRLQVNSGQNLKSLKEIIDLNDIDLYCPTIGDNGVVLYMNGEKANSDWVKLCSSINTLQRSGKQKIQKAYLAHGCVAHLDERDVIVVNDSKAEWLVKWLMIKYNIKEDEFAPIQYNGTIF